MAGSVVATQVAHRARGIVALKAVITCDASGVATATVIGSAFGRIVGVKYVPGTLATGVDITVTDNDTGAALLTLTDAGLTGRHFRPTGVIASNTGAAVTAATTATMVDRDIYVAGKIAVAAAQGGNLGAGTLVLIVDEGLER